MRFQKRRWRHDPRSEDFKYTRFFGVIPPEKQVNSLNRPETVPYNQGDSLRCAAYAAAKAGELIWGIPMSPDWQADKISRIQGRSIDIDGSDPNAAMASQIFSQTGGYLPASAWQPGAELDNAAQDYSDEAYLKPNGGTDYFESICNALNDSFDFSTLKGPPVQLFTGWYDTFNTPNIISVGNLLGYHSYDVVDFDRQNGTLKIVNSYGRDIGDQGYQLMSRDVVNTILGLPGTTMKIVRTLTAEQIAEAKSETPMGKIWRQLLQIWYTLSDYLSYRFGL